MFYRFKELYLVVKCNVGCEFRWFVPCACAPSLQLNYGLKNFEDENLLRGENVITENFYFWANYLD